MNSEDFHNYHTIGAAIKYIIVPMIIGTITYILMTKI
jgi:hypothetical protein